MTFSVATAEAVPAVLGLDVETAQRQLAAVGLLVIVVVQPSCTAGAACQARLTADARRAWRQDTVGGTTALTGSTVTIAVGPRQG